MEDKQKITAASSPADIAREAFKRLAMRRIAPTPDAYRAIYEEIAGAGNQPSAEKVLADFAASLSSTAPEVARLGTSFSSAAERRDWQEYARQLSQLVERHLKRPPAAGSAANDTKAAGATNAGNAAKSLTANGGNTIPLVDAIEPAVPALARARGISLVDEPPPAPGGNAPVAAPGARESRQAQILRDLLLRTLDLAVGSLLRSAPALLKESEALAESIRSANTEAALSDASNRLKQLCFRIELKSEDMAEEHELLLRLFRLLLENVSELLDDDSWLSGQIANVQDLLSGPINHSALMDATRSLKEVIYKQSMLKHSLQEAKSTVKNMMISFIDQLGTIAVSTGDYHQKMNRYSEKISQAKGITELNAILEEVMRDTRAAQTDALRSRDGIVAARQAVQAQETRIHELETKLAEMSELVREDQLTGSLNRRGLDEVLERELARSERRGTPLCVAMLDLDDFKKLNDTHGHSTGDKALIHLVRVVKDTLRTMDVVARFGGEEFLIVLPDTSLQDAMQTVTRVQRELTKRIFMHENQRLLITFSSGVALRKGNENQMVLIERADAALYRAKKAGKNRVIAAE